MANFDFKTATPDTSLTGSELWFGADSQSAATPTIYTLGGLKTYLLGGGSLAITSGKTLTATNILTLSGTDSTTFTFPTSSGTVATLNASNLFTTAQTISPTTDILGLTVRGGPSQTNDILALQDSSNAALATFDKDGKLTLGRGSALTGVLKFANSTNGNLVALQAGASSGNVTYTLPTADGSNGQVLSTNGSGTLSWKTDANSPAGSDTQLQYNNSGSFAGATGLTTNGTNLTITSGNLTMTGNISSAAWTTNGIRYKGVAATFTDTSTAASGTVATAYTNVYGGNTIAATNSSVTYTDYYTTFINGPTAGTNVTLTNKWALGLGSGLNITQGNANSNVLKATGYSLTGSDATSMIDLAGTWNTSGTPTAIKLNVTENSTPAAASRLLDLQVGGNSKFRIRRDGLTEIDNDIYLKNILTNTGIGNATWGVWIGPSNATINSTGQLNWTTGVATLTPDLILSRRGAANLRLGAADAAAPVAQTLSVQSVVAGTSNTAGANLTITGSQGTGTGAGGSIIFQVASAAGSTGTSQNALTTALTLNSDSMLVLSTSGTSRSMAGTTPRIFSELSNAYSVIGSVTNSNDPAGSYLFLGKSRGSTNGSNTVVQSGDELGSLNYYGTDGSKFVIAAAISTQVDGTPGNNDMPGRLVFYTTADGASSTTERLRITNTGLLTFAGATSSFPALKRSSTTLAVRLADDSADAPLTASTVTATSSTANTSAISSTGYSLTGSSSVNLVDLAGTWNTTGTPTGIKLNVTDTASNAASLLLDLQVGGSSKFSISKAGAVTAGGAVTGTNLANGRTFKSFTPLDNQPPASSFATLDTRNSVATLDFDDSAIENSVFVGVVPQAATTSSGIKARIFWAATSATSGDCRWGVAFEKSNGSDIDSDSFDTTTYGTTTTSGTSGVVNITEITCTTIDSLAAGDMYRVKILRDATNGGDTMTGDAELVSLELQQVS